MKLPGWKMITYALIIATILMNLVMMNLMSVITWGTILVLLLQNDNLRNKVQELKES